MDSKPLTSLIFFAYKFPEYNSINDMFRDLDEQKVDYILLDKIYANFYSKLINEKFYVMRQVDRKRSFNVLLRGFNAEQLTCFQTTTAIFSQLWIKSNLTFNGNKVKDTSKYFNITDELMYPHRNAILITAFVILSMIVMIGITWQTTCMKSPSAGSGAVASIGGGGGPSAANLNRGPPRGVGNRRPRPRSSDASGLGGMLGDVGGFGGEGMPGISSILGGGGPAASSGAQGAAGGGAGLGRNIFNQSGLTENIPSVRSLIPGGFLAAPPQASVSQLQDRSVKFNPLVHSFYYTNKKSEPSSYDKALWEQALLDQRSNNEAKVVWNTPSHQQQLQQQTWSQYKSDPGFGEMLKEAPVRFHANSYDFQAANVKNNLSPSVGSGGGYQANYSRISSLQSSPANTLTRAKYVPPAASSANPAYFNPHYDYNGQTWVILTQISNCFVGLLIRNKIVFRYRNTNIYDRVLNSKKKEVDLVPLLIANLK